MTNSIILNNYGPLFSFASLIGFAVCNQKLNYPYLIVLYIGLTALYLSSDYVEGRKFQLDIGFISFAVSFLFYFGGYYLLSSFLFMGLLLMLYSNTESFDLTTSQYKILAVFGCIYCMNFLLPYKNKRKLGVLLFCIFFSIYLSNYRNIE